MNAKDGDGVEKKSREIRDADGRMGGRDTENIGSVGG